MAQGNTTELLFSFSRQLRQLDFHKELEKLNGELARCRTGKQEVCDVGLESEIPLYMKMFGLSWVHYGCNVFRLGHHMTAKLILTDPPESPMSDARAPFGAYRIEIPPGFVTDKKHGDWEYIDVIALAWPSVVFTLGQRHSFAVATGILNADDGHTVKHMVNMSNDKAVLIVLNLISAMSSHAIEPVKRYRKTSSNARREKVDAPTVMTFHETKLPSELLAAARDEESPYKSHAAWKLKNKFIVRGHWRNQACGKGRTDHRLTWIEPHWKGPDGADGWARINVAD